MNAPGHRLHRMPGLAELLTVDGPVGRIVTPILGVMARPVRALLFDKSARNNWALGWHQDRTIVVKERRVVEAFGPWTRKQGLLHVAPPFDVLRSMVTIRVHLDAVPQTNAPLLVAPGSHRLGRIAESDIAAVVAQCGLQVCLAEAGDVWLYATPILHASDAAVEPQRRRVLQVDYAVGSLPGGLEWLGIA